MFASDSYASSKLICFWNIIMKGAAKCPLRDKIDVIKGQQGKVFPHLPQSHIPCNKQGRHKSVSKS